MSFNGDEQEESGKNPAAITEKEQGTETLETVHDDNSQGELETQPQDNVLHQPRTRYPPGHLRDYLSLSN